MNVILLLINFVLITLLGLTRVFIKSEIVGNESRILGYKFILPVVGVVTEPRKDDRHIIMPPF